VLGALCSIMWVGSSKKCVSQLTQLLIYKSPSGRLVLAYAKLGNGR
jgi:hypothetical protein